MSVELFDQDRIEAIAASLDLREPNKEALESIAYEAGRYFLLDAGEPPMRAVVDSATGVGKTYIIASALEYFAAEGTRNFAIITPGKAIHDKTIANFTVGADKSLLGGMDFEPLLITADNFTSAEIANAMEDEQRVKLYVFNVQALIRPTSKVARRTHKFQEGLGRAFYESLQNVDDLIVFADEQHTYFGPAFSQAIEDMHPRVALGLTATPHRNTPEDEIIYRYPMAAAISDKLVKTPVIVGRKDDRDDVETKLLDGIALLDLKGRTMERWCKENAAAPVLPLMLVVARSIEEANEIEAIVKQPTFAQGQYADKVLTVHSDAPDKALKELDELDHPSSPFQIVISVGMLEEGWDNKRVYVLASMRASVSTILTEQTLGRGMRLPFGEYTGIEILDTLEVLGHESYEQLLKRAGALKEDFIDRRTRAVLRRNAEGQEVPVIQTTAVDPGLAISETGATTTGTPSVSSIEDHTRAGEQVLTKLQVELAPNTDLPTLRIPRLRMTTIKSTFSLADITEYGDFEKFGRGIATDPEAELRRITLGARIVTGVDGLRTTELVTAPAVDKVVSPGAQLSLDDAQGTLALRLLSAPIVPQTEGEDVAAQPIIEAFLAGLGDKATEILSAHMDRAAGGLISRVADAQKRTAQPPEYEEVIEVIEFGPVRQGRAQTSEDRLSAFKRGVGYLGYSKSLYAQDWFDSSPERTVANILDNEGEISFWVRLQNKDLPILWTAGGRQYNPDLIAVERDGTHWIIEVKMDKAMTSNEVQEKRKAAKRWTNYVAKDSQVKEQWRYLLSSESDIKAAKDSWSALKGLGS